MSGNKHIQPFAVRPNSALRVLLGAGLAAAAGWVGYSTLFVNHNRDLPSAIEAERRTFASQSAGVLSYYVDRNASGRPLILIHSINAAGSAYEMRPLFEQYRRQRPVYALDLPGFGFSDRSDRVYSPALYVEAILDLMRTQVREPGPCDVVALSLSSEFAAMAAKAQPELFRTLALISPSGLSGRHISRGSDGFYRALAFPLWSQALYDLLVTRPSIRFFLKQSFEGPVDVGLAEYADLTTHQPGARFAPLYFVSGKLFTPNVLEATYSQLTLPVLVIYDYDPFVGFDALPGLLAHKPNWRAVRIVPTRGLPHFEKTADVVHALNAHWQNEL